MIIGIGIDILGHTEMKKNIDKNWFLEIMFTDSEREQSNTTKNKLQYFTGRFCAKEAFFKACQNGLQSEISLEDISVIRNNNGSPRILLKGKTEELFKSKGIIQHISISHSKSHSTAYVILEKEETK